ncbi:FtsB family cell division protein [Thermodesulfatator atlanticus]|uniref:FtsB family cell division protein n=1 Tax=Thermodesulfatator atlanticus TaxID=501497 RepID=UPI0003B5722F|nr:septum formation initiator family protein [Thermodesulfatator atlanticus]
MIFVYRPGQKKTSKRKKIIKSPASSRKNSTSFFSPKLIFGLIVLFFVLAGGFYLYLNHQVGKLSAKKENLLLTKAGLSAKISRLKTDPKAYEEIARRRYGLVKDGERLIIFE